MKDKILTGLRANSEMHLGNYLGAILPMIQMQKQHGATHTLCLFVPDLHSFTTPINHDELQSNILENLRTYVAAGLDINNNETHIYRQSYISAHSELTWILNCFAYYGELQRMTQFKDKSSESKSTSISMGLFDYPVLMASDILLYGAKYVPVGDDQKQHLELSRDLGVRMNNKFSSDLFVIPEDWKRQLDFTGREAGVRVRSLAHPSAKMSKSISDPKGTILLSDDPNAAAKKILSATTDSIGAIHFDWDAQPGVTNLLQIEALLSEVPLQDVISKWDGNERYGDLKVAVAATVSGFLEKLQGEMKLVSDATIENKLVASESVMKIIADRKLYQVQQAVGLRPSGT